MKTIARKIGSGEFGDIYEGVMEKDAEDLLISLQGGEVVGAYIYNGEPVDLIWGEYDIETNTGYGFSKICSKHPEVVGRLQAMMYKLPLKEVRGTRIILSDGKSKLVLSENFAGKEKRRLVTAFDIT